MKYFILTGCLLLGGASLSQPVKRYDVLITEIMADPTPPVGLPNAEYLELKNVSAFVIDIFGWKVSDATTTATITVHFLLQPDSTVILCSNSNVSSLSAFGKTVGVSSFPSLDNDGDLLILKNPSHQVIHAVEYKTGWYRIESKMQGGWSLEMIDIQNPCAGENNWNASLHALGGSPGKQNSVALSNADQQSPLLLRSYTTDSLTITLVFNEPVDSLSASNVSAYNIDAAAITKATALPPLYNLVTLKLSAPLAMERVYFISVEGVKDCRGNPASGAIKIKAGLPSPVEPSDVVINEILFDPRSSAYDYIEIFNRSNKVVSINELHLANRDVNRVPASVKKITILPVYIFPGEYRVVTENRGNLALQYLVKAPDNVFEISQLPSYPDDEGDVLLLDNQGKIIDEVNYKDDWHFGLISNAEGISLEKIDPGIPSHRKDNWHSAAATAGFGTPGYENSQYRSAENFDAAINVAPAVFSPDNDGWDDVVTISYQLEEPGFVAGIIVFDAAGRPVRYLVKNDLLGLKGKWIWDGLDDKKQTLAVGTYILLIQIYNLKGKRKIFKEQVVLARKQ